MAAPANSDFTYKTTAKLTATDWLNNFHQVVTYLTNALYDFTIGKLTCKEITSVGNMGLTGNLVASGDVTSANIVATTIRGGLNTSGIDLTRSWTSSSYTGTRVFETVTNAVVSLTTRASANAILNVEFAFHYWVTSKRPIFRINIDAGTSYIYLDTDTRNYDLTLNGEYDNIQSAKFITSLSSGSHTFQLELKTLDSGQYIDNNCVNNQTSGRQFCRMFILEV